MIEEDDDWKTDGKSQSSNMFFRCFQLLNLTSRDAIKYYLRGKLKSSYKSLSVAGKGIINTLIT